MTWTAGSTSPTIRRLDSETNLAGHFEFSSRPVFFRSLSSRGVRTTPLVYVRPVAMKFFGISVRTVKVARSLPIISAAVAAASFLLPLVLRAEGLLAEPSGPDGNYFVQRAAKVMRQHASVSAKFRQTVFLLEEHLLGNGSYLQQGHGTKAQLRFELKFQLGDRFVSRQQISDGQFLWLRHDTQAKTKLGRVNLQQLGQAFQRGTSRQSEREIEVVPLPAGLADIVQRLDSNFDFQPPRPAVLQEEKVWVLEGRLHSEKVTELLINEKEQFHEGDPPSLQSLLPHLPAGVVLLLGQEDLFPYRIEYHREPPGLTDARPIVVMQFFDVRLGGKIDPLVFSYQPNDVDKIEITDRTQEYVQRMGKDFGFLE